MRKLLLLFAFICFQSVTAQNIPASEPEIKKMLCRTWEIDFIAADGKKMPMPEQLSGFKVAFRPDNTYSVSIKGKKDTIDTWEYLTAKKQLVVYIAGKTESQIIALNGQEMIMVPPVKIQPNASFPNEVHLKPMPQ